MSPIVELRQYTLKPGQRDVLIELFEREFIESQEAVRMQILGTFRDAGNPDRFVWLRGFPDMESRAKSLAAFYGGPVWKAHRETANATMIDSDNVLLLRPAWPGAGLQPGLRRPPNEDCSPPEGVVAVSVFDLGPHSADELAPTLREEWSALGGQFLGALVTEHSLNTFPALPVREGENLLALFMQVSELDALPPVQSLQAVNGLTAEPKEVLRLLPTRRSRLPRRT